MQRLKSGDAFWLGEQTDMSEIVGSWLRTTQKAYRFVWFSFVCNLSILCSSFLFIFVGVVVGGVVFAL
jgi:hypothetical protein